MKRERLEYFAYLVISVAGAAALAFIFLRYVFISILPFLFGWFAAFASRRPAVALARRTKISCRVLRLTISAVATLSAIGFTLLVGRLLLNELWNFLYSLGEGDMLSSLVSQLSEQILGVFGRLKLPAEIESGISKALSDMASSLLSSLGGAITGAAAVIPRILLFIVITVISAIYFALDLEKINAAVKGVLPKPVFEFLVRAKNGALSMAAKYLRSYFLIMLITFAVMLVGFLLLRVDYAFLFAIIVAVLDLLPIVGVGTVLVPASVFCFLSGNKALAIGLVVLFVVNEVVRQLAEPRILGKHLGIHPLLTLAAMYIGYSFFGFAGLFLLPLLVVLVGIYEDNSAKVDKGPVA